MVGRQRRGSRYTAPGTASAGTGPGARPPRHVSPRQAVELKASYAEAFAERGLPGAPAGAPSDDGWPDQVRAVLADAALQFARAGFSDEQAVELVAHGLSGHVNQAAPDAIRLQLRHYAKEIIAGRHAH